MIWIDAFGQSMSDPEAATGRWIMATFRCEKRRCEQVALPTTLALKLAVLLVTHDLGVVAQVADRVAVMYAGRLVEVGDADALFEQPAHPYTAGLLRATPRLSDNQPRMTAIDGVPPDPRVRRSYCDFAPRCPGADAACAARPPLQSLSPGRLAACVRPFAPVWKELA